MGTVQGNTKFAGHLSAPLPLNGTYLIHRAVQLNCSTCYHFANEYYMVALPHASLLMNRSATTGFLSTLNANALI